MEGMRRTLVTCLMIATVLWCSAAPAAAGGWAMATLDATPEPVAGQPLVVGFTVLQHGVTPRHVEGEVGIDVITAEGSSEFFPARPTTTIGHYEATITLDKAGTTRWILRTGWFAPQDLGEIAVAPPGGTAPVAAASVPSPVAPSDSTYRWPGIVRYATAIVALLLAGMAAIDARRSRRLAPIPQ
jgi:hypothetical protein